MTGVSPMRREWTSAAARRIKEHTRVTDVDHAIDRIALRLLDGVDCPPTDLDALLDRLMSTESRPMMR